MAALLYKEEQTLRRNPIWLLALIGPSLFFWTVLIYQLITGELVGDNPMANGPLAIVTGVYTACSLYGLLVVKLSLLIYEDKIAYGWNIPTARLNEIPFDEMEELNLIHYGFVGYGYRVSLKYGTVYNVGGNKGLQIVKRSGAKLLIGTANTSQLEEVLPLCQQKIARAHS